MKSFNAVPSHIMVQKYNECAVAHVKHALALWIGMIKPASKLW